MTKDIAAAPIHVGFIIDGNRRWARTHTLPDYDGHLAGYNALKEVIKGCFEQGIQYVSLYAFSTENWKRDVDEVSNLMKLVLHAVTKDLKVFVKSGIRIRFIGRRDRFSSKVLAAIEKAELATQKLDKGTVIICFDYGGQQEIADAARCCLEDGLSKDEVTVEALSKRMYAPDVPSLDMVVRTSGEQRLSNFMLWRVVYSEFMFLKKYWPEMTKRDVTAIIKEYNLRSRRFGG